MASILYLSYSALTDFKISTANFYIDWLTIDVKFHMKNLSNCIINGRCEAPNASDAYSNFATIVTWNTLRSVPVSRQWTPEQVQKASTSNDHMKFRILERWSRGMPGTVDSTITMILCTLQFSVLADLVSFRLRLVTWTQIDSFLDAGNTK